MANKKINQLVSKTSILSTDLFGIGDATTGQLFKKTIAELQAAIGGAVISVNGLVGTVVLDTDDIQELATPTNKWFTDARARAAISLTVTGNSGASTYSSGTGVLNVPTYTLAGLGGITATFLSGGTGISYNSTTGVISYSGTVYTDASIRALLSGGTGISYNSSTGAISYSGTVYTDSSVRALLSLTTTGTSGASTYNNTTGVINVPEYTLAGLGGISLTSLSGGTGITYNNTTGAISYSGTVYTDASVRALISASGAVSYNNTTGVISLTSGNLTEATSSVLTITGGTGAVLGSGTSIQVKQATTSVSGFLSSTDWNTFNNKANALSGTTNYIPKFTSSSTIGNSTLFDDGNALITSTSSIYVNKANPFVRFKGTTLDAYIINSNDKLYIADFNTATKNIVLDLSTGAATFSSSVTASDLIISDTYANDPLIKLASTTSGNVEVQLRTATTTYNAGIGVVTSGYDFGLFTNNTTRMTITSSGNVGIGTSSPNISGGASGSTILTISATSSSRNGVLELNGTRANSGDISGYVRFFNNTAATPLADIRAIRGSSDTAGDLAITTSDTERMRITSGGNVLMGTTTDNGERLYVSGAIRATGTITANSDLTLKKNLLKIENALEKVEQINGYTYEFKADDSKRHAGVIAQEIQTVLPEIVNKGNDGILGVEYGNISALLIEAIKEQNIKIKNLETLLASK